MTKTYELPNEKMIMADVDEKHHTATVSVYALDDLVEAVNKADVLDKIRAEFTNRYPKNYAGELEFGGNICHFSLNDVMQIIDYVLRIDDNYRNEVNE